jgi:hypothetical protein
MGEQVARKKCISQRTLVDARFTQFCNRNVAKYWCASAIISPRQPGRTSKSAVGQILRVPGTVLCNKNEQKAHELT